MHQQAATGAPIDWDGARAPRDVIELLKLGHPFGVVSRQSGDSISRANIKALHGDASQALLALEKAIGRDLPELLPDTKEITKLFRAAEVIESVDIDGKPMKHRVVVLRRGDLVLVLMLGTATKLTEHRQSPAAAILADVVRNVRPSLLWAKRVDRLLRHPWAVAPLMIETKQQGTWIGDSRRGLRFPNGPEELMLFWDFAQAQEHAKVVAASSITGMREATGSRLIDGRVRVGIARVAPAGFARIKLRDGAGVGATEWILDTPGMRHAVASEVAVGLPECLTDGGEPADQVANVRWALSKIGRPRWSHNRVAEELLRRGYSTDRYRSRHGAEAVLGDDAGADEPQPRQLLRSLLANLDLYETGRLTVSLGDGERMVIEDLFPLDGPWASEEDFQRIRAKQAELRSRPAGDAALPFTGLRCLVNGVECVLRKTGPGQAEEGHSNFYFAVVADELPDRTIRPPGGFKLDAVGFATLVMEAIAAAGERAVALVPSDEPDEVVSDLHRQISEVDRRRAVAAADRDAVDDELSGRDGYRPSGARKQHLNDQYNRLHEEVDRLDTTHQLLVARLQERRDELRAQSTPARVRNLLRMVASLADPNDATWREVWLSALRDIRFTTESVLVGGMRGTDVHVEGVLAIGDGDEYGVPLEGTLPSSVHSRADERVDQVIELMREGVPIDDCDVPMPEHLRPLVARRFGADTRRFPLGSCHDPRVLRIAVGLFIDGLAAQEVAERSGEPVSLVRRVAELHAAPAFAVSWRLSRSRVMEDAYALAHRNDGKVSYSAAAALGHSRLILGSAVNRAEHCDRWTTIRGAGLRSDHVCGSCGGRRLAAMSTSEPAGRLCLDCRHDSDGVRWPADPYDAYLAFPGVW